MTKKFLLALAIAVPAGALCAWLRTPLPWMIGPLVACAIASGNGLKLACPVPVRQAGQWAIGAALGLYFTPEVVARILSHWWPVVAGLVWSLVLGLGVAWSLRRFAGADPATAFFAGAVGGASEMALQGERSGGSVETIAAAHSLRIMMVVIAVPFAFRWLGIHGDDLYQPAARAVIPLGLVGLVAITVGAGLLLQFSRSPNAWVIGPLLASGLLTGVGITLTALPQWMVNAGQVALGTALGVRFAPGFFRRAPRFLGVVFVSSVLGLAASAGFAVLLGWVSGLPAETLVLATAPGGMAEMSLTARVLQLGVPEVTVFHVARLFTLVMIGGAFYRWLAVRLGWPTGEAPLAVVPADDA